MRLLLLHVRGPISFNDLKTYVDVSHDTFESACRARGLLIDDTEWTRTLNDAAMTASPRQMRELFVTILGNCQPSNPCELWEDFKSDLSEDFVHRHTLTARLAEQYALKEINDLILHNYGLSLTSFGFSLVENLPDIEVVNHADPYDELLLAEQAYDSLNSDQRLIFDTIVNEVREFGPNVCRDRPRVYFIDAPGGTGKTFVFNSIVSAVLSRNLNVASCAWTGIAGNLIRLGRTVHRLFKLPVPILETSTCNVTPPSKQADFIRSLSIILLDEASMIPGHALSAIDRMLRDITENDVPFGGKLLLFAGDFRQILPVVPRAHAAGILEQCINRSLLWSHFTQFRLSQNMRARPGEREFCDWLIQLGDGTLRSEIPEAIPGQIDIPPDCNITDNIVDAIFPDFNVDRSSNIILTPINESTHLINNKVLEKLDGPTYTYQSYDKVVEDGENEVNNFSVEFLHSITPSGMPPHELKLKIGCPIIVLRNLDTKSGLCNGTRLVVRELLGPRVIDAEIISGSDEHIGRRVFIPKIKLTPSDTALPFKFQRTQFPVRLAYCMTINKSQGQTFNKVGLYLPQPVFSHGQLYVSFSRARAFSDIYIEIHNTSTQMTTGDQAVTMNVVYDV